MRSRFGVALLAICLLYGAIEAVYVLRLPLVMDEFQSASAIRDLAHGIPYRDFTPYKNVLGHYLQLPALLIARTPWSALMLVKLQALGVNVLALAFAALLLRRHFRPSAVLSGLALTIVMSSFLERSAELRVDMLTAWPGLFSLLLLLHRRWLGAGILAGISFLVSQKGVYFCVAGAIATLPHAAAGAAVDPPWKPKKRLDPGPSLRFVIGALTPIAAYVVVWGMASSLETVYAAVFGAPQRIAFQPLYEDVRFRYWLQTVWRNPIFYLFAFLGLAQLGLRGASSTDPRKGAPITSGTDTLTARALFLYGLVIGGLGLWHRQPWPYFFVLLIPTLFVLLVAFLDRVIALPPQRRSARVLKVVVAVLYVLIGIGWPLTRIPVNLARDNGYQRHTLALADCLLRPGDTYFAGVDVLSGHEQPLERLRWLDQPEQQQLASMPPLALQALVDSLVAAPPKVVIDNYRVRELAGPLRRFLDETYTPLWGSVLVRAATTAAEEDRASACTARADDRYREPREFFPNVYRY
jgi:hypothetical protein